MAIRYRPEVIPGGKKKYVAFAGRVTFGTKTNARKFLADAKKVRKGLSVKDKRYRIVKVKL